MSQLVECVPNFSEGRDEGKILEITNSIKGTDGITLLDVDLGEDTNRTVVTFVGSIEAVEEAAFRGIQKAAEVIDMRQQKGSHPRMGATDVCPFVPVSGVTVEECVELSKRVGSRVGEELGIPVYLYENSAQKKERKNLPDIREGEYEALPDKLKKAKLPSGPLLQKLKEGKNISYGKKKYLVKDLTYKEEDKKVCFVVDTRMNKKIVPFVKNSNLLICETTFGKDLVSDAKEKGHLTSVQAGEIAKKSKVKKLVITHVGSRYDKDVDFILKETKKVFKNSVLVKDLDSLEV